MNRGNQRKTHFYMAKPALIFLVTALCLVAFPAPAVSQAAKSVPLQDPSLQKLLAEASQDLSAGRFGPAASRFRSILAHNPNTAEALFGLGVACSQLGRLEEAQESLRRYVRLQPSAADGHSVLGLVFLAAGKRADARIALERSLRLDPRNLEAAKALAHVEAGDYHGSRVVNLLQPFARSPEFDNESKLLLATGYAQSGNNKEASSILGPLLEQQPPPPPEAYVLAAASSMRAGDGPAAGRACTLGLRAYLNSDEIEQCCLDIARKGELDSFISHLESSLRGIAEDVPNLILLGRLMSDANPEGGAPLRERGLELLQKAVSIDRSDASALYNLGRCLRVLKRSEEAIARLERALTAQPDEELQTLIHTQIGLAERELQRDTEAEQMFRQAFEHNHKAARFLPDPAFAYYTFLVSTGKAKEAAAVLDDILKRKPDFLPVRLEQARAMSKAGHFKEAAEEAELVVRNSDPESRELLRAAHLLLVRLYTQQGRTEEAGRHVAWLKDNS
jgi:tetratricopeptide (TPR) repeat protein